MRAQGTRFRLATVAMFAAVLAAVPAHAGEKKSDDSLELDEEEDDSEAPEPTPPPVPGYDDQRPLPYTEQEAADERSHLLDVGPHVGVAVRTARGDRGISYQPALAYGAFVRAMVVDNFDLRIEWVRAAHGVDAASSELVAVDGDVEQPALDIYVLGAVAEGYLHPVPEWRLRAGLGVRWGRVEAPPLEPRSAADGSRRTGTFLEYPLELGASYEVVRRLLQVDLALSAALVTDQSGDYFTGSTAFAPDGTRVDVSGYPDFGLALYGLLGVTLML